MENELEETGSQVMDRPVNTAHFKNQAAVKATARSQVLEALTAYKGAALGKRGLIFRMLESLEADMDSDDREVRTAARDSILKMTLAITKDEKGSDLSELLKGGANVQINFNSYFADRNAKA